MKKFLLCALALLSLNAFASKARLQSLAQGDNGSLYIDDKRNVFLNPAYAYKFGRWANFEWGTTTTPSTPNAEGGMFYDIGSNYLGIQLGRESNAQGRIDNANSITPLTTFAFIAPQNTINLLYAFKSNVTWGFQVLYGTAEDRTEETTTGVTAYPNKKANTLEFGAGVESDQFDIYAKLDLQYSAENEVSSTLTHKLEGKPVVELGGSYKLQSADKIYGNVMSGGYDVRYSTDTVKKEVELMTVLVGYAHYLNPDNDTRFYISPAYEMTKSKIKDGNGGIGQGYERNRIPVTIAMEMTATEWMDLRASVTQRVLIDESRTTVTDKHNPNSTTVAAGAGLKWKRLTIDGTLRGAVASTGFIDGNYLLSNVGMTYNF